MTEPTDRSMPRVRMTKSMPTAMMPAPEATWRSTLRMFGMVRKLSDHSDAATTSTRKIAERAEALQHARPMSSRALCAFRCGGSLRTVMASHRFAVSAHARTMASDSRFSSL